MSKILILAEKPSLAKEIANSLDVREKNKNGNFENETIIIASLSGHLLEAHYSLPPSGKEYLPLECIDHPTMKPKEDSDYIIQRVKSVFAELDRNDVEEIVSAGDADPEGSLLVYELLEFKSILNSKKITRMWIQAVDEETLKEAFKSRYDIEKDLPLVEAAKARALADARVGFNYSRLFSMKGNMKASVGRVRTALMQIVRYRELEIENFQTHEFYNIKGTFDKNLIADLMMEKSIGDEEEETSKTTTRITEEYYSSNKDKITEGTYEVVSVETVDKKILPDLLPNQNDILKNVSKLHKFKSKEVVEAMQSLYESGFISYPRTEKRFLPTSLHGKVNKAFEAIISAYKEEIGEISISHSQANKRIYNNEEVEEHFAVVPWMPISKQEIESLPSIERKTYDYVVAKFLMSCMPAYEYASSVIVLQKENLTFKATGKIEKIKGYKEYKYITNQTDSKDIVLPNLQKHEKLELINLKVKKDTTKPPALLSESVLLEMMENVNKLYKKQVEENEDDYYSEKFSLGTPATRVQILDSVINKYHYIDFDSKDKLITTPLGKTLLNVVSNYIDLRMTAQFEAEMNKIQKDKTHRQKFDAMIKEYVNSIINVVLPTINTGNITLDIPCPLCNEPLQETQKLFKCSKNIYKDNKQSGCKFFILKNQTKYFGRELENNDLEALLISTQENPYKDKKEGVYLDLSNEYFLSVDFQKKNSSFKAKPKKQKWSK